MIIDFGCSHSVEEVAKKLKGYPGRKLLEEFPYIKRKYFWGSGLWGGQTYFNGVGDDREQKIQYVRNQGRSKGEEVLHQTQKQTKLTELSALKYPCRYNDKKDPYLSIQTNSQNTHIHSISI